MTELFLNPWSMAAGALLIASPILIHLINRMRFRRVRWAAMEFLLKAQKRMRRKLIFQQLLLLLLRILLVLLLGLLVARFLGFNPFVGKETRTTTHIVILDDSPSMGDTWRGEDGQMTNAFEMAKRMLVEHIAPSASEATTPQTLELIRMSDVETPRSFERLNSDSIERVDSYLKSVPLSQVRGNISRAMRKAQELANSQGQDVSTVIHLLSDFRTIDWQEDGPQIKDAVDELVAARAKVFLTDVVHPFRKEDRRPPLAHDNIAILELKSSQSVVARYESIEFQIRVKNFGNTELTDVRYAILVNGDENKGLSINFPTLPAHQEKMLKFNIIFDQIATQDRPLDRFSLVTAKLESPEPGGITTDNVRHAVVEVRERLPILAIEGRPQLRDKKEGDGFYLNKIFTSVLGGFTWVPGVATDLENDDLRRYAFILVMNVPSLSETATQKLEQYVREGGGVAFFLGPDVRPEAYNSLLYADGKGLFPVPLPERPTEPLSDEKRLERLFTLQKKLLLRDPAAKAHPALFNIYYDERGNALREEDFEKFFSFVIINQYWPVRRLSKWQEDPNVTELYCMPNEQPMGEIEPLVKGLLDRLPVDEPKYAKYQEVMVPLRNDIRRVAASTEPLYTLANLFDRFLSDQRSEGDKDEALIREFWAQAELADLRQESMRLRDAIKYGDPLYLVKEFGRGRVTTVLTTAGEQWNDWPTGPGRPSFVPIINELERYLSGGGAEDTLSIGDPIRLTFPAASYQPVARRAFMTVDPAKAGPGPANPPELIDLKEQTLTTEQDQHVFAFTEANDPGAYLLTLTKVQGSSSGNQGEVDEYRAFAVNLDSRREGDLARAGRDDILQNAPTAGLYSPGELDWLDKLKNKQTDLTEAGWIFLVLLGLLCAEQALAVRMSYHLAPGTLDHAAPSAAAIFQRSTGRSGAESASGPTSAA